ncbi:MAG: hypothetical protein KA419_10795 [Acidobacteria bacterium]|nr:hypothetical protein [Acidobacteriota bacterium]
MKTRPGTAGRDRVPGFGAALFGLFALWALGAPPAGAGPLPSPPPGEAAPGFEGRWDTTYGPMTLVRDGDRVTGSYVFGEARCTLEGTVEKGKFVFTYREPSASGEGWFALSADGTSFAGQWRERESEAWFPWTGRRGDGAARGFEGLWDSRYGRIRLVGEEGNHLRGCYAAPDGSSSEGTLEGALDGRRLSFRYTEAMAKGEGWFELAPDGSGFTGKWRADGSDRWSAWDGTRVTPVAGRKWLVVVEANWEPRLGEREYSFGAMLKAFFQRSPNVRVRHRFFRDEADVRCWLSDVAYLAEPVVVVLSSHGQPDGVPAGGVTLGPKVFAEALRFAPNVELLHFASCLTLSESFGRDLLGRLAPGVSFPVSGYATSVDWGASAVLEFLYYDLVLARDLDPAEAARQLRALVSFAGDRDVPGAPFASAGFRFLPPKRK